jgi:hypothetical protein
MSNVPKIYELNGRVIRKIPIKEQWSGGTRFTVGFPVCTLSEYVLDQGEAVVALLNMGEAYQTADGEDRLTVEQAWTILCETPDITSPEEYPDHALITMEQLGSFMARASLRPSNNG